MFEIRVGELRATFLRNYNMRRHIDPKRKTTQAEDNPSTEDPHNPDSRHKHRGAAPVTWRCTRTEEVHCLRIGCTAPTHKNKRGTGTPNHSPPHPSMRNWALQVAGRARRPRGPRRPRCPRRNLHSGPLRPTPTPPTPLHAKSRFSRPSAGLQVSWRPGRAAGCRSGPAGARGDHASRGQAHAARAAAATTGH